MSKANSQDLHDLIKSLSKMEKRYVKIYISGEERETRSQYVMLFDAIERNKKYDEARLKKLCENSSHFPIVKNRLYRAVLKGLENYHSNKSVESRLRSTINQVELLFNKGLEDQCMKLIVKAKKTAINYQKWEPLLEILRWEWLVISHYYKSIDMEKRLLSNSAESDTAFETLKNFFDYQKLKSQLLNIERRIEVASKASEIKQVNKILAHPLLKDEKRALSVQTLIGFNYLHSRLALLKNDPSGAFLFSQKYVELSRPKAGTQLVYIKSYYNALIQYIVCCFRLYKFEEAESAIAEMKSIPSGYDIKDSAYLSSRILISSTALAFALYINTGEFYKALVVANQVEKEEDKFEKNIMGANRIVMQYYIFYTYFGVNNYKKALKYLNRIISLSEESGLRNDVYLLSRLVNIVVHYELGHTEQLPYFIESVYRYLTKQNELHKFEKLFLEFMKALSLESGKLSGLFEKARMGLQKAIEEHPDKRIFESFDFISWVDSKTERRPFADIVREKIKGVTDSAVPLGV